MRHQFLLIKAAISLFFSFFFTGHKAVASTSGPYPR